MLYIVKIHIRIIFNIHTSFSPYTFLKKATKAKKVEENNKFPAKEKCVNNSCKCMERSKLKSTLSDHCLNVCCVNFRSKMLHIDFFLNIRFFS